MTIVKRRSGLMNTMLCNVFSREDLMNSNAIPDDENDDDVNGDDSSIVSNDESVCRENNNIRQTGGDQSDDEEEDPDNILLSREEREERLEIALKKLGNMSRKPLNKYATTDLFKRGQLTLGNLSKTRKAAIDKRDLNRQSVYQSIKYFRTQMRMRRLRLERCVERSADPTFRYHMPSWKRMFKEHMKSNNNI